MTPTTLSTAMQEAAQMPSDEEILSLNKKQPVRLHHGASVFEYRLFDLLHFARAVLALHRPVEQAEQRIADLVSSLECEKRMRKDAEEEMERMREQAGNALHETAEVRTRLYRFLDVAAGEGYVFGGIDAADLFRELFDPPIDSTKG